MALLGVTTVLLAACGSSPSSNAGIPKTPRKPGATLTVYLPAVTQNVADTKEFQSRVASEFTRETGAKLSYSYYSSTNQEQSTLETSVASHVGPDVFSLGFTFIPAAYATNEFVKLTPQDWTYLGGKNSYLSTEMAESGPDKNHTIGVPVVATPHALAYNTALFKKAGISAPPTTWTQFVEDAQKINDPSAGVYGTVIDPADTTDPWKNIWTLSTQLGGRYVSSNNKTVEIDSPANVKATEFWFDWYTKYHITPPQALTWNQTQETAAFASGTIGMQTYSQSPFVNVYRAGAIKNNFAFAPMPSIPYGMSSRPAGGLPAEDLPSGQLDVIAKYAPDPDLALAYIKIVTSNSMQELQWKLVGDFPIRYGALAQVKKTDPQVAAFVTGAENADPTPFTPAFPDVELAWSSTTQKLAAKIATSGSLPSTYVKSVLQDENAAAQKAMDASS